MAEFDSLGEFIRFLGGLASSGVALAQQRGRLAAALVVRDAVRETLGVYQVGDTGPFKIWAQLAEDTQARRERYGFTANAPEIVTTALWRAIKAEVDSDGVTVVGVPDEEVGGGEPLDEERNIGDVAVAQEIGTEKLPPRSFLGIGGFRSAERAAQTFAAHVVDTVAGRPIPNTVANGVPPNGDD